MIPTILAGIVTSLIQNNLPKVAQAVVDKGVDYVEDKLGVELKPDMTPEELAVVRDRAMQHLEFMTEQDNRNTADARDLQKVALQQGDLFSKRFIYFLAGFWSLFGAGYIIAITFATIPEGNVRFADTILGFLLGTLLSLILNYFFGSSSGSGSKQGMLERLIEKLKP